MPSRPVIYCTSSLKLIYIILALIHCPFVHSDFVFSPLLPSASGFAFNGNAHLSRCEASASGSSPAVSQLPSMVLTSRWATELTDPDPNCGTDQRLRLTASYPDQVGSIWQVAPQRLINGFNTTFQVQVANRSRLCTEYTEMNDANTTTVLLCGGRTSKLGPALTAQRSGGFGFAFVLHFAANRTAALGSGGRGLGFDGIDNSVVVEFLFTPTPADVCSTPHFNIKASGAMLAHGVPMAFDDSRPRSISVVYFPTLRADLASLFVGGAASRLYFKHPMGTLCVYFESADPTVCLPISLPNAIRMQSGRAYAGFTASTGAQWQSHDIVSWRFCEAPSCV